MAAGCSASDWERVEESWDLDMYRLMQTHWTTHGPPLYIAAAGYMGYRAPSGSGNEELIEDPDQLAMILSSFPGGRVVSGRES